MSVECLDGQRRQSLQFLLSWFLLVRSTKLASQYHPVPYWTQPTKLGSLNQAGTNQSFSQLIWGRFQEQEVNQLFADSLNHFAFLVFSMIFPGNRFLQVSILFTYDKRGMTDANSLDPQRQSLPVAEICTIDPLLVHLFYSIKYRADATQIYNVCGTNIKLFL